MKNIIKAQMYQIRHDRIVILFLLSGLAFMAASMLMNGLESGMGELSAGLFLAMAGGSFTFIAAVVFVVLVPRISGWDLGDKTINYEIMSGHARKEVYFGRVMVSLAWSLAGGMAILFLPLLAVQVLFGWGNNMNFADAIIRCVLAVFPLFRIACGFILLTFLLKNCYMAMIIGWILFDVTMIVNMCYQEFTDRMLTFWFGFTNLTYIFDFSNYKFEYIGGEDIPVYVTTVSPSMAAGTVVISLLAGIICIAVGYVFFCRQDMD